MQFTGVFAPTASSVTNQTPHTQNPCHCFCLAGVSARSPVNLPVLALAPSASCRLLAVYSSSHLVRPVLRHFCVYEAGSASEAASSFPISDLGTDGVGSSSFLIWMLHASASCSIVMFPWPLRVAACSFSLSALVDLHARVSLVKKIDFSQDFRPISDRFLIRNFRNPITPVAGSIFRHFALSCKS